jgi:hypothetical protein
VTDRRVAGKTGDERPRDIVGPPQDAEHEATDRIGRAGGALGENGQGEQDRCDALQHVPVRLDPRGPVLHGAFPAKLTTIVGRAQRVWKDRREGDGKIPASH